MTPLPDSICERLKHFPNFFWWPHLTTLTLSPAIGLKIRTKALSCQTPAVFMENLRIQFLLSSSLLVDGSCPGPRSWPSPQHRRPPTGWEWSGNRWRPTSWTPASHSHTHPRPILRSKNLTEGVRKIAKIFGEIPSESIHPLLLVWAFPQSFCWRQAPRQNFSSPFVGLKMPLKLFLEIFYLTQTPSSRLE